MSVDQTSAPAVSLPWLDGDIIEAATACPAIAREMFKPEAPPDFVERLASSTERNLRIITTSDENTTVTVYDDFFDDAHQAWMLGFINLQQVGVVTTGALT